MVSINKEEKKAIQRAFPNTHIVRTMKQDSKRGHYYCTEERGVMKFLKEFRSRNVTEEHPSRKKQNNEKIIR